MKAHSIKFLFFLVFLSMDLYSQNTEWSKQIGGKDTDQGNLISIDSYGNSYIVGTFLGTVDFDSSTNVFNLSSIGENENIFICKLDANGNFVWAKNLGSNKSINCKAIALDTQNNVYLTGSFLGTVDFNLGDDNFYMSVQNSSSDTFISKLDTSGNFVWAKQFKGKSNN